MSLKDRISSPLEAGTSILDAHHLPPHLVPALEYTSARLARKALHVTLIAVRRDYQLPSVIPPPGHSPALSVPATPSSPRFGFAASPVAALKQLVRSGSVGGPLSLKSEIQQQRVVSPMTPVFGLDSPRTRWPVSPRTPMSPPPMAPSFTTSSTITDTNGPGPSNSCGFRLIHPAGLSDRDERTLRHALQRAQSKFSIVEEWLSPAIGPAACGLTDQIVHRSIAQNEVLFSSEGMTILTLDRLYSLRAAISAYTMTRSPLRLEDAVDELRRLVLATNGRMVRKADLLRSYDWLSVSHSAVFDVDRMYKRAYGGPEGAGAISGMGPARTQPVLEPAIRSEDKADDESDAEGAASSIGIALTTQESPKPKSPKGPVLKLQTSFDSLPRKPEGPEEDGDRTARPSDWLPIMIQPWNPSSIDEVLSPGWSPARLGPRTPNGYDDISPTTRGEWGFLMVDDAFKGAKTATVETC